MAAAETVIPQESLNRQPSARSAPRSLAGPAVLLLIFIGFFWKLLLTNQFTWLESPDLAYQVLPWFQYEAEQFHQHRIPIWDPYLYGGQSLIGQDQPGLAYPLNWLLFALPFRDGHISFGLLHWYYMLIHYLAALFCYLLCRDLGRSIFASVLGGLAFGLGGYMGTTDWPQMLNGAIWVPLVFLFLFRAARGVHPLASAAFSGSFLGISWLSGHHQIPIFVSLAAGGVWLYFFFEHSRIQWPRAKLLAVFLAFFFCAGALQMWPAFSYGHTAVRWVGSTHDPIGWNQPVPYDVQERGSLSPIYLLGTIIPGYRDFVNPYVGVVAFSLVALALACWWKNKEVRILCGVGVAGLLLALAKNDVFHGILYSIVPLFEKARAPATAIHLFHFAVAVLAAFGLDSLWLPPAKTMLRRLAMILLGFGTLVFLLLSAAVLLGANLAKQGDDRVLMPVVAAFALAGLIYRASRAETARAGVLVLITGLYLVELGNVTLYDLPHQDDKDRNVFLQHYGETRQIADFFRKQRSPLRVWINSADVPFNFGDWYGIDTMDGYTASMPRNVVEIGLNTSRTRALYGAAYTVSKKPLFDDQREVFRDENGIAVYQSASVLPRAWTVHEAIRVADAADAQRHLQDPGFDLRRKTFGYAAPPQLEQCDGDTVQSFRRGTNSASAVVDLKCRGMVVLGENNAPGWIATVDGKPAPIYEAYTTLRGVVAGPGTHRIETRYRPLSVSAGATATLAAFLAALGLGIAPQVRRRKPGKPAQAE